jgi:hypothetical protein
VQAVVAHRPQDAGLGPDRNGEIPQQPLRPLVERPPFCERLRDGEMRRDRPLRGALLGEVEDGPDHPFRTATPPLGQRERRAVVPDSEVR